MIQCASLLADWNHHNCALEPPAGLEICNCFTSVCYLNFGISWVLLVSHDIACISLCSPDTRYWFTGTQILWRWICGAWEYLRINQKMCFWCLFFYKLIISNESNNLSSITFNTKDKSFGISWSMQWDRTYSPCSWSWDRVQALGVPKFRAIDVSYVNVSPVDHEDTCNVWWTDKHIYTNINAFLRCVNKK